VPDLGSEPAQLHQLRLAAARASSSPSARLPCQLPRALFPADPDAVPTFASAEVARGFVAAWRGVLVKALRTEGKQCGKQPSARGSGPPRTDRSAYEVLWHLPAGALCRIRVSFDVPALGLRSGGELRARLVSLDGVHGLLLYPDSAEGCLYTASRLCNAVSAAAKWKGTLRMDYEEEDEDEGEDEDEAEVIRRVQEEERRRRAAAATAAAAAAATATAAAETAQAKTPSCGTAVEAAAAPEVPKPAVPSPQRKKAPTSRSWEWFSHRLVPSEEGELPKEGEQVAVLQGGGVWGATTPKKSPLHVCMYVCMYACMHVWMYVCMHVCM